MHGVAGAGRSILGSQHQMTDKILGVIANNINPKIYSLRLKFRRSREFKFGPHAVDLDGQGNILGRPRTAGLSCFGDPVEYLFGRFDQPRRFKEHVSPNGCGGCNVQQACYLVADERIETDPVLSQLHEDWEGQTKAIPGDGRFQHPTFGMLRAAIEDRTWTDSNDKLLADERRRIDRERKTPPAKRKRTAAPEMVAALEVERVKREQLLLAARRQFRADHRFRHLSEDRCKFTARVWHTERFLSLTGGEVSNAEIARYLISIGATYGIGSSSMVARVGDAMVRCKWLENDGEGEPVWPEFVEPIAGPQGMPLGMSAAAVTVCLDADLGDSTL